MLTVNAGFKMHMLRSSTAGTSGQSDRLSGFHRISALYQILEVMTVNRFQPVRMTDYVITAYGADDLIQAFKTAAQGLGAEVLVEAPAEA